MCDLLSLEALSVLNCCSRLPSQLLHFTCLLLPFRHTHTPQCNKPLIAARRVRSSTGGGRAVSTPRRSRSSWPRSRAAAATARPPAAGRRPKPARAAACRRRRSPCSSASCGRAPWAATTRTRRTPRACVGSKRRWRRAARTMTRPRALSAPAWATVMRPRRPRPPRSRW